MTTITLTAESSGSIAPYIDVLGESFPVDAVTTTAWRTADGRSFRVRGLVRVSTSGTVTIRDFEAPIGVESSYRFEHFDVNGDRISWSDSETAQLDAGEVGDAWFHNPFDPTTSVRVSMAFDAAQVLTRPTDLEKFKPKGRSLPVIVSRPRRGVESVALNCSTATADDEARLDALFGDYDDATVPVICVRAHPWMRLPPTLFATVDAPARRPYDARVGGENVDWFMIADEAAPPVEAAITALLDYADFTAYYASYAAFTAAYVDYREAQRDYSIATI